MAPTAEFSLPDSPPPGNTFPPTPERRLREAGAHGTVIKMAKGQPRAIVVELKELDPARSTPQHSESEPEDAQTAPADARKRTRAPPQLTVNTGPPTTSPPPPRAGSQDSEATLRADIDGAEESDPTPVMQSMFPRYNPDVRASRQLYSPPPDLLPPPPPLPASMRPSGRYSPSLYSTGQSPPVFVRPAAMPGARDSGSLTPAGRIIEHRPEEVSSPESLLDLWTIANGQFCQDAKDVYTLGLQCDSLSHDRESMQLNSSTATVYQLRATGEAVCIVRTHPMEGATEITIATPSIDTPSTTSPLLAAIYPSLAELLAMDQAATTAAEHQVSRQESTALQAEALQRARNTEAASLLWDSDSSAFFFTVPALASPTAPLPQALSITIVPGKTVALLDPARRVLLSLDLHQALLTIHTPAIIALSSSLYTLDILMSTLLTLLLHLHRHTALLKPYAAPVVVPYFEPPPKVAVAGSGPGSPRPGSRTSRRPPPAASSTKLNRWLLRRSDASHAATDVATMRSPALSAYSSPYTGSPDGKDLEAALGATTQRPALSQPLPEINAKGIAPELRKETTGVDLSRFQAYDLSDPALGHGTRAMLRVLYWFFSVLVWVLGVFIGVVAATIVAAGGVLGGGKGSKKLKEGRIDGGREG